MSSLQISGGGYQPPADVPAGRISDARPMPREEDRENTPTLVEQMQEAREKAEEARKKYQLPKDGRRYGDAAIEAYSRLARARNASQVASAAGYARRQIFRLKAAKKQDSDNARQIQGAINQLQKAVTRAGKKRRDLAREELSEKRRKKLVEEEQVRKAKRLREQLKSRKTMRMLRESGYIREAEIDHRLHAQMDATAADMREQFASLNGGSVSPQDAAISHYAAQAASLEAPPPAPVISAEA